MKFAHEDGEIWIVLEKTPYELDKTRIYDRLCNLRGIVPLTKQFVRKYVVDACKDYTLPKYDEENIWQDIRYDESCDGHLYKAFLPYHLTDDEWKVFQEYFWLDWYNPYGDGRDCTGVRFTSWMGRYETKSGTWIYHKISRDI